MAEKKYELHVWFNEWDEQAYHDRHGTPRGWGWRKVVLSYKMRYDRVNQIDHILRNEWWHEGCLVPFRDVLRMESKDAGDS